MLKSSILHFIIIGLFSSVLLGSSTTISELKSPEKNTVDFTFNSVNKTSQSFSTGTIVDKVSYELNSLQKLFPRLFKVSGCQKDSYNTLYCPDALVKAAEYWGYDQSEVIAKKQTVIDFEQGTYQELTSTVRDFMDGFASTHNSTVTDYQTGSGTANVGTVIDYQSNSTATVHGGNVIDYTTYITEYTIPAAEEQNCTNYKVGCHPSDGAWSNANKGTPLQTMSYPIQLYQSGQYKGQLNSFSEITKMHNTCDGWGIKTSAITAGCFSGKCNRGTIFGFCQKITCSPVAVTTYGGVGCENGCTSYYCSNSDAVSCPNGYYATTLSNGKIGCAKSSCPSGYSGNGTNCQKLVNYNMYSYQCPNGYTPINNGFSSFAKSDPDTLNINDYSLDDDVNSSIAPASNCQKTITYSYYKYNCPTGYTVNDGGLTSACPRTDPNNTINNEATLSQACNNSTPPTGNCTKIIPYTFYSYECSSGYTAIEPGLATCTKTDSSTSTDTSATLDDPCNSVTPPKENCYKDISYKYYTYGCSPGYITDNYGLSTCPKTDPNKSVNNSATLDDDCNSATPPPGNCQKPIEFSYFQYICTGTNAFGETYSPINPGLTSCNKTDPNNITVNGTTLDDACNSSTPPVNNCQATEYTCNSNIIKPALVDGKWQCSPYVCNSEQKCGTATCNDYPPSKEFFMEESLLPMKPDYNGSCVGVLCDMTMNKNISYCDAGETCPKINGVYTKNGKCYYDDCPQGSFLDANGNCVVD